MIKSSALASWTARAIGGLFIIVYVSFLMGEIYDGLFEGEWVIFSIFAVLLLVSIVGYCLAWSKPMRGGAFLVAGGISMALFHITRGDLLCAAVYGMPFIFSGVLFMISAMRNEHTPELDLPGKIGYNDRRAKHGV